ncbi:MAG: hypothetical protein R2706_03200 [Acidimicrobiales bacterium]
MLAGARLHEGVLGPSSGTAAAAGSARSECIQASSALLASSTEMAGGVAFFQAVSLVGGGVDRGVMIVAGWTSHRRTGSSRMAEYVFIIGVVATALAMLGPGQWSLDRAIGIDDDLDGWVGLSRCLDGLGGAAGIGSLRASRCLTTPVDECLTPAFCGIFRPRWRKARWPGRP